MPLPLAKFREIVFHLLYSRDFAEQEEEGLIEMVMASNKITRKTVREALVRVALIEEKKGEIDPLIQKASTEYQFDRISGVERNLLRLGVFELLFDENIPPKVAIAEGIRLCKKFGSEESADFINAILDKVYHASIPAPVGAPSL